MALAVETVVLTPAGVTSVGRLIEGDQVIGGDGLPCRVRRVTPAAAVDRYRVTLIDGQDVITAGDQTWPVLDTRTRTAVRRPKRHVAIRRWDLRAAFIESLLAHADDCDDRELPATAIIETLTALGGSCVWRSESAMLHSLRDVPADQDRFSAATTYRYLARMAERRAGQRPAEVAALERVTTLEMSDAGLRMNGWRYAVPMPKPLDLPVRDLPIDPYVYGVWLGDGTRRDGYITCGPLDAADMVHLLRQHWPYVDEATVRADGQRRLTLNRELTLCPYGHQDWRATRDGRRACRTCQREIHTLPHSERPDRFNETLGGRLRRLGLNQAKRVPVEYQRSSFEQRLLLLQGLMDTDGHVTSQGGCTYVCHDEQLVHDILQLIRSLGVRVSIRSRPVVFQGRPLGTSWKLQFTTTLPVARLPRKAARLPHAVHIKATYSSLIGIEPVENGLCRSVEVDSSDGTFLVADGVRVGAAST